MQVFRAFTRLSDSRWVSRSFLQLSTAVLLIFGTGPCASSATGCDGVGRCYVRSGAQGAGNGADWTNAYVALPAALVRGVTYYVAAGRYPGHLFADPDEGAKYITVRAPTASDHGTGAGWSDTFVGQAVFDKAEDSKLGNILTFQTDYYIFDGVYRSVATGQPQEDWSDETGYGFKIDNSAKTACNAEIDLGDNATSRPLPVHHIFVEHVDVNGSHETAPEGCRENGFAAMWGSHDYALRNSYIHDTGLTILFLRGEHANCTGSSGSVACGHAANGYGDGGNIAIEDNYLARNFSDEKKHAEGCSCSEGLHNLTIAYNYWQDIDGTAIIATASGADWNDGNGANGPWYIYGNVAFETSCAAFAGPRTQGVAAFLFKWSSTFTRPIFVLNNTIENFPAECNSGSGILLDDGAAPSPASDIYVMNNLWAAAAQINLDNTCPLSGGYASCRSMHWVKNAYYASPDNSGADDTDPGAQISASAAPFANARSSNFLLMAHTLPGADTNPLFPSNSRDLRGTKRGGKQAWDRGALQRSAK